MTNSTKRNDPKFERGYWVELEKARFAGGVSAETQNFEWGLGAVYHDERFGITGHVQYTLPFILGRVQIDFLSDKTWLPQFAVGVPIRLNEYRLEPHLLWPLEENTSPRLGLRVQYQF